MDVIFITVVSENVDLNGAIIDRISGGAIQQNVAMSSSVLNCWQ